MKKSLFTRLITLILFLPIYTLTPQEKSVSLLFAGDAMQHKSQIDVARTSTGYDYSAYFPKVKDEISAADIAIINLEVTLAGKPHTGYPSFSAPDEFAQALKDCGFDIFLTSNNHANDKRRKGVERTIEMLDSMRVRHTGTFLNASKRDLYYPLMMIKNGIRIAFLNYTYDTNGAKAFPPNIINYIDKEQILQDIKLAKEMKAEIIIANMHWGYEYKLMHNKEQKELADFLIENGVRIVIGTHPHVVQPLDIRYDDNNNISAIVAYSLGNFVSGMKVTNTTGGMMLKLMIDKDKDNNIRLREYDYSLVWTHKTTNKKGVFDFFELLPVSKYNNADGEAYLGTDNFKLMTDFATTAEKTIKHYINKEKK